MTAFSSVPTYDSCLVARIFGPGCDLISRRWQFCGQDFQEWVFRFASDQAWCKCHKLTSFMPLTVSFIGNDRDELHILFTIDPYILSFCQIFFGSVQCIKPASSREKSAEHFIVCKGYARPHGYIPHFVSTVDTTEDQAAVQIITSTFEPSSATSSTTPATTSSTTSYAPNTREGNQVDTVNKVLDPFLTVGDFSPFDSLEVSTRFWACSDIFIGLDCDPTLRDPRRLPTRCRIWVCKRRPCVKTHMPSFKTCFDQPWASAACSFEMIVGDVATSFCCEGWRWVLDARTVGWTGHCKILWK